MDSWIVALRGESELLEGRALFGPPIATIADTELYVFDAATPDAAARLLLIAAESLGRCAGAAGLETPDAQDEAREAVLAAALAVAPGDFVVCGRARARLAHAVVYVRPKRRRGWRIPVPSLAISHETPALALCLAAAATLPSRPALVHRSTEIETLCATVRPGAVTVLRAAAGVGGSRVLSEAAAVCGAAVIRVSVDDLHDDTALDRALRSLPVEGRAWVVIDPIGRARVPAREVLEQVLARAPGVALVLRAAPDVSLDWVDRDAEVEVGPLAPNECRDLVMAMLGEADPTVVAWLARRGAGSARVVIDAVRQAVQRGEVMRAGGMGPWRAPARRVVHARMVKPEGVGLTSVRVSVLGPLERRSLQAVVHVGEGIHHRAMAGLLRALFGPPEVAVTLLSHGLMDVEHGRVTFSAGLADWLPVDSLLSKRIDALRARGVLDLLAAAAEAQAHDAARVLALAARRALAAGDVAVAVRLCVAAGEIHAGPSAPEVQKTRADIARALGAVVTLTPRDGTSPRARPRLDPGELNRAAVVLTERGDDAGAQRLRALAALAVGDTQTALQLTRSPVTSREHLVGALAHAQEGNAAAAARSAVGALSVARRGGDTAGEVASLTLLGALYTALGKDVEAQQLALAARTAGAARKSGS